MRRMQFGPPKRKNARSRTNLLGTWPRERFPSGIPAACRTLLMVCTPRHAGLLGSRSRHPIHQRRNETARTLHSFVLPLHLPFTAPSPCLTHLSDSVISSTTAPSLTPNRMGLPLTDRPLHHHRVQRISQPTAPHYPPSHAP